MESNDGLNGAVAAFYAALNAVYTGDAAPMVALWSAAPYVTALHSLGDKERGGEAVRAEWERVAARVSSGQVRFQPLQLHANGDLGYAVGVESGAVVVDGRDFPVDVRVTNIFERTGGAWQVVHHHADTAGPIEQAIG